MENERFTVENIGRYVVEHDSADSALRLSWSGSQLFMNEQEARALLALLLQLYSLRMWLATRAITATWREPMQRGMSNEDVHGEGLAALAGLFFMAEGG